MEAIRFCINPLYMEFKWESFTLGQCGKVRCEPGWSLQASWSEHLQDCDLWYVWAGSGRMRIDGDPVSLRPGTCLWMRPGSYYLAEHDPERPLGVSFIHFTPRDARGRACLADFELPQTIHTVRDPLFFSVVMTRIVSLLRKRDAGRNSETAPWPEGQTEWLFRSLIEELLHPDTTTAPTPWIRYQSAIEGQVARIFEQPSQVPSVSKLAGEIALSPDHYSRIFRRITGASPRDLIQQARLERACQLLHETPLSITEIAEQAGYSDVFQFSRLFKRKIGEAPTHWR